jgi:DNA-directed RNA polymerase subunit H (RpoH/RPB5)
VLLKFKYVSKKDGSESKTVLLHSKLQTKQFPEITKILDKIVSYLPNFNGQIITYEKEEESENSKKK